MSRGNFDGLSSSSDEDESALQLHSQNEEITSLPRYHTNNSRSMKDVRKDTDRREMEITQSNQSKSDLEIEEGASDSENEELDRNNEMDNENIDESSSEEQENNSNNHDPESSNHLKSGPLPPKTIKGDTKGRGIGFEHSIHSLSGKASLH